MFFPCGTGNITKKCFNKSVKNDKLKMLKVVKVANSFQQLLHYLLYYEELEMEVFLNEER